MTSMHSVIPAEKLTEAYRLLLKMRDNCVKHADDQYDDPKREAKYEALNIAITAMGRSILPRWISVEERLPEELKDVLVYRDGCFAIAHIITGDDWTYCGMGGDPTHWMPLPELPKEE